MQKKKRKKRQNGKLFFLLAILAFLAVLVLSACIFFEAKTIKTEGSTHYSDTAIIKASGVKKGDKLVFLNSGTVTAAVAEAHPYVKSVQLKKKFPDTVTLVVTEEIVALRFEDAQDGIALAAINGKLLETVPEWHSGGIKVSGFDLKDAAPGTIIDSAEHGKQHTLMDILTEINARGIGYKIGEISVSALYDIQFTYENRITVKLGMQDRINVKFNMFTEIIKLIGDSEYGILDVSAKQANFIADVNGGTIKPSTGPAILPEAAPNSEETQGENPALPEVPTE